MEITPDKRKFVDLVEAAYKGRLCLPNFQRDFIWARDEIADLIRSVLRGYFVGSLLLLHCDRERPPFAPAFVKGAKPEFAEAKPDMLILDGQQRITSLLYALTAPEGLGLKNSKQPRRFFVDLDALLHDADEDDIVFDATERDWRREGLDDEVVQFKRHILPCTRLLTSRMFHQWRDGLDDYLRENDSEGLEQFRGDWRDRWTEAIDQFQHFQVPIVELPAVAEDDELAIGRVCAIFEKLNSTGVELSVYDLLTARLFRSKIDLHKLWNEACEIHPLLAQWSGGNADQHKLGVLVLRCLALLRGLDPKPRFLINLQPKDFGDDWRRAAAGMERALELITHVGPDGFGVFDQKWLPGFGLVPVLAALRSEIEERGLGDQARADLRRWYWCNVFLERYSSAVESKSRRDYAEFLRHWLEDGDEPSVFGEAKAVIGSPGFSIRTSTSYASSIYSGVFCLLAIDGARDWAAAEAIELQQLEDHHIFPRAYLVEAGFKTRAEAARINTVVNRTLISDSTNRLISRRAPAIYLEDPRVFAEGKVSELLASHFIDRSAEQAMRQAVDGLGRAALDPVFDKFCQARESALLARVRSVCGV